MKKTNYPWMGWTYDLFNELENTKADHRGEWKITWCPQRFLGINWRSTILIFILKNCYNKNKTMWIFYFEIEYFLQNLSLSVIFNLDNSPKISDFKNLRNFPEYSQYRPLYKPYWWCCHLIKKSACKNNKKGHFIKIFKKPLWLGHVKDLGVMPVIYKKNDSNRGFASAEEFLWLSLL